MFRSIALFASVGLAGCGVSDGTLLSDLTDKDVEAICDDIASESRTVTCEVYGYSFDIDIGQTAEECVDSFVVPPAGCLATVGDVKACNDAFSALTDDEVCAATGLPAECAPLADAACGTTTFTPTTTTSPTE